MFCFEVIYNNNEVGCAAILADSMDQAIEELKADGVALYRFFTTNQFKEV